MPWVWWVWCGLVIYTVVTTVYVVTDWRYVQPKPFTVMILAIFWILLVVWFIKAL